MKKQVRKMTNRTAGYIFFYNLIMVAVMFGAVAIRTIAIMAGAGSEQAADRAVGAFGQNMGSFLGILSIAGVCGGQPQDRSCEGGIPEQPKDGGRKFYPDILRFYGLPDNLYCGGSPGRTGPQSLWTDS